MTEDDRQRMRMQLIQIAPGLWTQLNGMEHVRNTILTVEPVQEPQLLLEFTTESRH